MTRLAVVAIVAAAALLAGCGEKAQTAGTAKKSDAKPWDTPIAVYSDGGWKSGDKASWEAHLRERTQGQNEYSRSAPAPSMSQ